MEWSIQSISFTQGWHVRG